jgi:nitrite reductase (cytochrome c-552)
MPFISEGGQKFTDHHIQSPLNNIAASCQVCHREETDRLVRDVYLRQDKILENRVILEKLLVRCHLEAKEAWDKGANEKEMEDILRNIRRAQWRWDFTAAGHGNSFHSPVETGRIIAAGINLAQEARVSLARLLDKEIPYPEIETKSEAQSFIGLDMNKYNKEKEEFLESVLPGWLEEGKKREEGYDNE